MTDAFVGKLWFRSNAYLEGRFEDEVYLYGNRNGMVISRKPRFAAYNLLEDLHSDEEITEILESVEDGVAWTEILAEKLKESGAVFRADKAKENGLLDEDEVHSALHSYLEERSKEYGSYSEELAKYRQGEIEGWRKPANEEDLVDRLIEYEYDGLASPDRLIDRIELMEGVRKELG